MSNDAEFDLCEPFDIDHGELDGMTPQQCFVLGVEWQMCAAQVDAGKEFQRLIHTDNKARIEAMLRRRGRDWRWTWLNDDWLQLNVEAM